MSSIRHSLGELKTLIYRRPMQELQRFWRWGPRAYFLCDAWAREMERHAFQLPVPDTAHDQAIEVWYLTGRRFWYQTAFCAWTLATQSNRSLVLNLVDDGSLESSYEQQLRRLFPRGITLRKQEAQQRLDELLPASRFPLLRQRWADYTHIRKLTDIHLGSTGVKLVLDSDMLFFSRPDSLLSWWDNAKNTEVSLPQLFTFSPCLMTDCAESYGYSRQLMEELVGAPVPPLLNVGVCGLRSQDLDWEELEHWCRTLTTREGTSYYLEQALAAMIAARHPPTVLPATDYITFPTRAQVQNREGALQHYVADSKPWYFGEAWRQLI